MAAVTAARATVATIMAELKAAGKEQTVKTYRRHGVRGECFGVSYADLGKLKKRLKTDHQLARGLWQTGNHDARVLATMIADPAATTGADLDGWVQDADCYVLTGPLAQIAARLPDATARAARWMASDEEWTARAGWQLMGALALWNTALPDAYFEALLPQLEAGIHTAKNRVRDAMNDALIAIGARSAALRDKAVASAIRVGKVMVDHGETGCKTPDAVPSIEQIWGRRARQ